MNQDYIASLDYIGFTARIKRLSDLLIYSARAHYKTIDIGIEPNWHLIFLILKDKKQLTITDIAQHLRLSHPAVIKIISKMKTSGYIKSTAGLLDQRKQYISLSNKALKDLPRFESEWRKIEAVIKALIDKDFLEKLTEIEHKLETNSFIERYHTLNP